jgi:hypothetical protein
MMGGTQDEDALAGLQEINQPAPSDGQKKVYSHASGVDTFVCPSSSGARVRISSMSIILLERGMLTESY